MAYLMSRTGPHSTDGALPSSFTPTKLPVVFQLPFVPHGSGLALLQDPVIVPSPAEPTEL